MEGLGLKLITKIILATVSLTSCSITSNPPANEFPMTCAPPVGHLNVVYYEAENIAFYRWGTKGIELKKVEDVKTHPLKIPSPHNVYGGSVWKWDLSRTGVSQSVLGSDWRLDAPYDRSADGNWLAAAVYSASEGLSYSSTKRLVLLAPEKAMEPIILSLPHEIEALSWSP